VVQAERAVARVGAQARPRRRQRRWGRAGWVAVFVGPAFLLYATVLIYPLLTAFSYSFFSWSGLRRDAFVGFGNYSFIFRTYPFNHQLVSALSHNTVFFIGTVLIEDTIGLGLALLLHSNPRGKRFFQLLFSTPYLISPLVVGYLWSLMLSPLYGPVNALLRALGLDSLTHAWLGDPNTALPTVVLINAWQWAGFPMLIFGAALAAVPQEIFDAARVDGAGWWRTLRSVTLPLIVPAIGVVAILTFVGTFNVFDLIYAIGGSTGGPGGATDVLALLFYRIAFGGGPNSIGVSSSLAVMLFAATLVVSLLIDRSLRRREVRF
jgi:raffinose/stachyose/melibiose transport system permease protein